MKWVFVAVIVLIKQLDETDYDSIQTTIRNALTFT